jgi:hypothetical protein
MYAIIQVEKASFSPLSAPIFELEQASPEQGRIDSVFREERRFLCYD